MNFTCKIVLGSSSPRRKQFFQEMNIPIEIRIQEVDESYPKKLQEGDITEFIAIKKAKPLLDTLNKNEVLITSDTLVSFLGEPLGKPSNNEEAFEMLLRMSGKWHRVYTSVCFSTTKEQIVETVCTDVKFMDLSLKDIQYYVDNFTPLDKAGAYGIQEWIGLVGIEQIKGSYTNVVGLPTAVVYKTLTKLCKS
jgi:septum formation protein